MPNKSSSSKFAEIIPPGAFVLFCGMGAISMLSLNLIVACFLGTIGLKSGVSTLKMKVEKLDKLIATIGIVLSVVPLIYVVVIFTQR